MCKIPATSIILILTLLSIGPVRGQPVVLGYPGFAMDTVYSQPARLGSSMFVMVNVTNLSYYITASVESVILTFDWGVMLTGSTPWSLQPGENNTWQFDEVEIPSTTWTGTHACVITVSVTFRYPKWRLGRILSYENTSVNGETTFQFQVQSLSVSSASTLITGPRLVGVVSNVTVSSPQPFTSLIAFLYRITMAALVVGAVVFLLARLLLPRDTSRKERAVSVIRSRAKR